MTSAATSVRFGPFELQRDERRLLKDGAAVLLRPHAFDILSALVDRAGHLVTKDELLQRVWGSVIVEENTLQVHVSALRKVLGQDAIATVLGQGYRFTLEVARSAQTSRHNLPYQLTSFVGREREIDQVQQLLASTRLLTLTGAGGCGKTRLALQVATQIQEGYPDGVWFVELAPLVDSMLVAQALATALGVKQQASGDLEDSVAEWLRPRHLLLVLDNAEHVLSACAQLADKLLRRCARLALIVTSRERLGIAGELTYRVPSLSIPDARHDKTSEEVLACEAARLFVERARLQRPDLVTAAGDVAALASICRRLDGIALAIELAAARMRTMSIQELSARLDDRFAFLTDGSRVALPRHRTLRSLIDWSYDLLGAAEKTMLRRASVFAGGWTLEAAEEVCSGGDVDLGQVLNLLTSLADKNLVIAETRGDATRFGMLETVRHYALERLRQEGAEVIVRGRHLAYFMDHAKALDEAKDDAERKTWMDGLEEDHDNLRAALAWCEADSERSLSGLSLFGRLYWMWLSRFPMGEGRAWIARLLAAAPGGAQEEAHAGAFHAAGSIAYFQADFAAAEAHHAEALNIWRRLGQRRQMARSLGSLGAVSMRRGDHSAARTLFEQALTIAREVADRRITFVGLLCLGMLAYRADDLATAEALLEESLSIAGDVGIWSAAGSLVELGRTKHAQGKLLAAREFFSEALEKHRAFGSRHDFATTLIYLGMLSVDEGDTESAKTHLREALEIQQVLGHNIADALDAIAALMTALGSPAEAARIWGRARRLREETGIPMEAPDQRRYERHVAAARSALQDDAGFDAAWNEGRSLPLDHVVAACVELLTLG